MKSNIWMLSAALIGLSMTAAQAQETAPTPAPQAAAPATETLTSEDWNPVSRSATRAYLADVGSLLPGDPVSVRLARVPLNAEAGDYSFTMDDYEFQCAAGHVRVVATTDYGPDGAPGDRYPEEASWEDIPANSLDAYLKAIVCDGDRAAPPTWPSIKAFIDAGRPSS